MAAPPELVLDARARLGEGPLWDPARSVLWWLDILAGEVHAFEPATGHDRVFGVGAMVGVAAPMADGRILLGLPDRVAALDPEAGSLETVAAFPAGSVPLRCNDGQCDAFGRFWVGRMALDEAAGLGSLVRLDRDGRLDTVVHGLSCPNGMGWSAGGRTFLLIDSPRREVSRYAWDAATGLLGELGTAIAIPPDAAAIPDLAVPDGMAIDRDDHLWVAIWGGGCVLRLAPDGTIADRIALPVSQPTSCAFGGPDLRDLYITSARDGIGPTGAAREPHAGGLFRVRPGPAGREPHPYRPIAPTRR